MNHTEDDYKQALLHMVGATQMAKPIHWGYRNYYAPGADELALMGEMEFCGLVVKGQPYGKGNYYHATEEGCRLIGMPESRVRVAFEAYFKVSEQERAGV